MAERKPSQAWMRLAGLGRELTASIAGGALLGWGIERRLGTAPWALVALAAVGIVGGMYNLIRTALAAARELERGKSGRGPGAGS